MDNTMTVQKALANIQETFEVSLQQFLESYNKEVLENNCIVKQADSLEQKNIELLAINDKQLAQLDAKDELIIKGENRITELERQVIALCKDVESATTIANNNMVETEQTRRELVQMEVKLTDKDLTLTNYKAHGSTPKKVGDKIKRYQKTISDNQTAKTADKKTIREVTYERDQALFKANQLEIKANQLESGGKENCFIKVYSEDGHHLFIYPNLVDTTYDRESEEPYTKEMAFLYLNDSGKGGLMTLDSDNDTLTFPRAKGNAAIRPKAAMKEYGAILLRKFQSQNWQLTTSDLNLEIQ